jgi:PadR family transcriptional regulator PadR
MDDTDLYAGLIRLHILHHAVEEGPVYGLWMIEELARHGYRVSPGTLYPILHGLERKGYLRSSRQREGPRIRRTYVPTPDGRRALASAKERVWELFGELFEQTRKKPRKVHTVQHSNPRRQSKRRGAQSPKARNSGT